VVFRNSIDTNDIAKKQAQQNDQNDNTMDGQTDE
jgi:hypothetical protein